MGEYYPKYNINDKVIEKKILSYRVGIVIRISPKQNIRTVKFDDGSTVRYNGFGQELGLLLWETKSPGRGKIHLWSQELEDKYKNTISIALKKINRDN